MTKKKLFMMLAYCTILTNAIYATNYYVSVSGNDSNTGTSITRPFKTIQRALNIVRPGGHTIYVMGGTYKERLIWKTPGLSTAAVILLTNYNGANVSVDGSSGGTNSTQNELLLIRNMSHIEIRGINFTNNYRPNAKGIHINGYGSNLKVNNCRINRIGWSTNANTIPRSSDNANPLIVVGSNINSINNLTVSGTQIFDCVTGYSEALTITGNVENFAVVGNILTNITNIGIDIAGHYSWTGAPASVNKARKGKIQDNVVSKCVSRVAPSAGIYVDGGESILIERNKLFENGVGASIGCENPGFTVTGIIFRDNIVYNNRSTGLYFGSNQSSSSVAASKVINNTFYKNAVQDQWGAEIALQNTTRDTIWQNIFVPNNDQAVGIGIWGYQTSSLSISYNLFWRTSNNAANFWVGVTPLNNVLGNPKFVNAAGGDFHLMTGSKAINTGIPSFRAAPGELDIDKQARVQANRVDIGADESNLSGLVSSEENETNLYQLGQDEAEQSNLIFRAFPNPTTGMLSLQIPSSTTGIKIVDGLGRELRTTIGAADLSNCSLDLSSFDDGIYFIHLSIEGNTFRTLKIVKQAK